MTTSAQAPSCMNVENGCVMFDCLTQLWEWIDPPSPQSTYPMENKQPAPATQQPLTQQQHYMAHHVHPDQIYSPQSSSINSHLTSVQSSQIQPNGVMHQLLQSQYHSNMNARSPLLENRQDLYGTTQSNEYARHYGANDNYNYPQSPPKLERTEILPDHNVNHELLQNMPKGYNAEVYQDYLKRNPPKDTNQIYQNHQHMYKSNVNQQQQQHQQQQQQQQHQQQQQLGSKPYLPYSNRIGPQSNTELLRRQYNEIQQMKLQQQIHYQNQAQMHQQQKFAERQLLLQQIHGVQPPPNLQTSLYSDGSYRDLDRYSSKNDFREYSSNDIQKEVDRYIKNNEYREPENQSRYKEDAQWQSNQATEYKEIERFRRQSEGDKGSPQSPQFEYNSQQNQRNNVGVVSPMKSSESSSPSVKSPSSDSRRSSGGNQALRSPVAQRTPSAPVAMAGILYKQGSDGLKVWRKRWFVLSEYCLFYYKSQDEQKLLGSVLLPSYKVSPCTSEDKVLRKFAFKLEHANMRTYILAAPDLDAMTKWVKVLTMAAVMQTPNEPQQNQNERMDAKAEDDDEIPGPTYANAPPKPRRSNEGYNSPSSDIYDPNYDLLKKPASQYSLSQTRYQDHSNNYPHNVNQESLYGRSPQSPPAIQQQQYQSKRPYDTHQLTLPLTNTLTDKLDYNQPSTSANYRSNPQSPYFDNRNRAQQQPSNEKQEIYNTSQGNPFIQENLHQTDLSKENDSHSKRSRTPMEQNKAYNEIYPESRTNSVPYKGTKELEALNREIYGELNARPNRTGSTMNERLVERRTPDAYGRSTAMSSYNNKDKIEDYEDVYAAYSTENEYGKSFHKSPEMPQQRDAMSTSSQQQRDAISISSQLQAQEYAHNYPQEKTFSGPSVLRRKKMQACGIQPPVPRPHSADFLEYEAKNEALNRSMPESKIYNAPKQPPRPKSSLDINSYYDPSSDKYYSEESYAAKMRQSAQYLQAQQALGPKNIQTPLAKYASGLAEKQLNSPYSQQTGPSAYDLEIGLKTPRENSSYSIENSNWTLKEKNLEEQKEYLNRNGGVLADGTSIKEVIRFDPSSDGFTRSASARLPSNSVEKEGEKKVQQREESMKRLLEWKQRMLQSPLTRKSTPATISLARSLNQSRQSLRSDQYKSKSYQNASYNSYSSDDEEETSGTDLQKRKMQAGRSHKKNLTSSTEERFIRPHASPTSLNGNEIQDQPEIISEPSSFKASELENTYENILCTITVPKLTLTDEGSICEDFSAANNFVESYNCESSNENCQDDSEESEAESENLQEYTDNDLDEVLLEPDSNATINIKDDSISTINQNHIPSEMVENGSDKSSTPPVCTQGENHYLPMSPRKLSTIEPAHKTLIENLSVFNQSMPTNYEDNPYVEMNLGAEDEDGQTYEFVCVNNGKSEPVYMELNNIGKQCIEEQSKSVFSSDSTSNFADTKEHTLKRVTKQDKSNKEKIESSDADDELSRDISSSSLETPFNRFSISDNFRPASYYLNKKNVDRENSSDSEILSPPPLPLALSSGEFSDEALSKYILDKLDQSGLTQDNSILKMLTSENQNMNTVKRKATSLMIYGSRTSIHDTLTRGEKIRNSRASLTLERNKVANSSSNLLHTSIRELCNSSSIESDSLRSYNDDRGSSRLSLESDVSSKFDIAVSNISSEVASLNGSESAVEIRDPNRLTEMELLLRRRPISEDSLELIASAHDLRPNVDLDRYLDNLQPSTSTINNSDLRSSNTGLDDSCSNCKDNVVRAFLQTSCHLRCSSTPANPLDKRIQTDDRTLLRTQLRNSRGESSSCFGSQCSNSSTSIPKSPISYYCKNNDEEKLLFKNLNNQEIDDKIREFECDKVALKISHDRNGSSTSTGFHSRESSTEHSAPYYYSDLSSQEHINVMPTSHFLKNTNVYRKLNNQRRRGPLHKKNEISHIHNPIRNNHVCGSDRSFELAAARSVSVEFLSAADKDTEIDMKNIYESSSRKPSKIPESMQLIGGLGCKKNLSSSSSIIDASSPECSYTHRNSVNANSTKLSSTSMSSHCSGNSSNTVYYDAEADTNAYENIQWHGEKHWDEDTLWRDNLRRVSHRHARSMDDLDAVDENKTFRENTHVCGLNSIKRVKKTYPNKVSQSAVYVNCDIQAQILEKVDQIDLYKRCPDGVKTDDNDVYVSLAKNISTQQVDEGLYEQLAVESSDNSLTSTNLDLCKEVNERKLKKKFEIDREKLRQWDLMSSGLMKGELGRVREINAGVGTSEALSSMDTGTDSASNQASITMTGANIQQNINNINNSSSQQTLSKKAFLGSNTSIGRANRDTGIPVRAVSPRVRWVEEKATNDHYGSQYLSTSQHNLNTLQANDDTWTIVRSPSRASQQPIRAVSPRVRRETQNDELQAKAQPVQDLSEIPTAGELLGRTHEELVLLLIQLRRRHAATHRAIEQCCAKISCLESSIGSLKAMEREKSLQRLEQMKIQLLDLESQYEKSKPLVQLVDNMVKLGSLYNRPGSTIERLERNQRLREKVLTEHALEQQRWLESAAAGKSLETEAARARVAELWALEQELADEAAILQGLKSDKGAVENLITDVRTRLARTPDLSSGSGGDSGVSSAGAGGAGGAGAGAGGLEAELARVHAMLAYNSKQLEQTVQDNARLERELRQLRRALQGSRVAPHRTAPAAPAAAQLQDEVTRVQQLVTALQKQRQDLSRAVRHLTQQSQALQNSQNYMPATEEDRELSYHLDKHLPQSSWQETNLDTGHTTDHQGDYDDMSSPILPPGHYNQNIQSYDQNTHNYGQNNHPYNPNTHGYEHNSHHYDQNSHGYEQNSAGYEQNSHAYQQNRHGYQQNSQGYQQSNRHSYDHNNIQMPLYVDTRNNEVSPEDMQNGGFANLSNVEKQEIKTVRIVKRESERRQRDRERSLQPMSDWSTTNISANLDQFIEEELVQSFNNTRASSLPRTDFSKFEEYYSKPQEPPNYLRLNENKNMDISPKFPSSPSLSNYDYSRDISSLSSSYNKSYDRSAYDRTISISTQYLNSPTDSSRTLTNDPLSKTSSVVSLTRSNMELSPIFKSEAAKQIITEMSDVHKNGSLHRRQVPKEKRRHYTAPHHLSAKTLNELPMNEYNQDKLGRSLDDTDMERALRGAPAPDVVRSALPPTKFADSTIDQLLAAPQKIVIPERYIPEKPPELSPEEQQKRQEKVESIKKMLSSGTSNDTNKSPDGEEKKQREHLLQMNQILAKQVTEMSKIIAVKALEELPQHDNDNYEDRSPDVELPIYQQRDNFFS